MTAEPRPGEGMDQPAAAARSGRLAAHQAWLNPHIRMCAIITAAVHEWGTEGERVMRAQYRKLGLRTGRSMLDQGLVPEHPSVEEWAALSDDIADMCGMERGARLPAPPGAVRTEMHGCGRNVAAYRHLDAPPFICDIPMHWDNGCLETVNPELAISVPACAYLGAEVCVYQIGPRDQVPAGTTHGDPPEREEGRP